MDKTMVETTSVPAEINEYSKSNFLIGAKYKSTLLENKILALSLAMSDQFEIDGKSPNAPIRHSIAVSELRRALHANRGSFYTQLNQAAASMTGKTIGMTSNDSKVFDYIAVVTRAKCIDGVFSIEYNGALRDYLYQIKKNYSRLNLDIMLKFSNNYAFRLYELLKSKCYHRKNDTEQGNDFTLRFLLSELKLEIGIVNSELDAVKKVLRNQKRPDFDLAVEKSPEKMFSSWSDFRRKVLDKATAEINEISDMTVSYKPEKKGQGGKVFAIVFDVKVDDIFSTADTGAMDEPSDVVPPGDLDDEMKLEVLVEAKVLLGKNFSFQDIKTITEKAGYNMQKIKQAYDVLLEQKTDVPRPTGFMIAAIEQKWSKSNPLPSSNKAGRFANFEQREYDFAELEKKFVRN